MSLWGFYFGGKNRFIALIIHFFGSSASAATFLNTAQMALDSIATQLRDRGKPAGNPVDDQPPAQCVWVEVRIVGVRLTRVRITVNKGSAEACGFSICARVLNVSVDSFAEIRPNVTLISRRAVVSPTRLYGLPHRKRRELGDGFRPHRRRGD